MIDMSQQSIAVLGKRRSPNSESPVYQTKRFKPGDEDSMSFISSVKSRDIFALGTPNTVTNLQAANLLKLQQQESVQTI